MSVQKDENGSGTWFFTFPYTDFDGTPHRKKMRGYQRKADAQREEAIYKALLKNEYGRMKVWQLRKVYELSIKQKRSSNKEASDISEESYYRLHVEPYFANMWADEVTEEIVSKWIDSLEEKTFIRSGEEHHYKPKTIEHCITTLSKLFTFAKSKRILLDNPVASTPKYRDPNEHLSLNDAEINCWDLDTFNHFLSFVKDKDDYELYLFLFYNGLRVGEAIALRWTRIDFDESYLEVRETATYKTKNSGKNYTSPKNRKSIRRIDLSDLILKMLKDRYDIEKRKDEFTNDWFVFGGPKGLSTVNIARNLDKWIKVAKVKRITPHGFRHSHATMLIMSENVPDVLIAERLGHTLEVMYNTYAHIYSKKRQQAVKYINIASSKTPLFKD